MEVVRINVKNLTSLKSILIGGKIIDCFNDQNNDLTICIFKSEHILNITLDNASLAILPEKSDARFLFPITNILFKIISNIKTVVFVLGEIEFHIPITYKDENYKHSFDETCVLGVDSITSDNYRSVLPSFRLANYEIVANHLEQGVMLDSFGLFNKLDTLTDAYIFIKGVSRLDGSPLHLIFERMPEGYVEEVSSGPTDFGDIEYV